MVAHKPHTLHPAASGIATIVSMIRSAFTALVLVAAATQSISDEATVITGSVESIASSAWVITGIDSALIAKTSGLEAEFRIDRIVLLESGQAFDDVRVVCRALALTTATTRCADATFTLKIPGAERQAMPGAFSYDSATGIAEIELSSVSVADGRIRASITSSDSGFDVRFSGNQLQLSGLLVVASSFSDAVAGYSVSGLADVTGSLNMPAEGPTRVRFVADVKNVSLANDAGTIAAESVTGRIDLDVIQHSGETRLTMAFDSQQGEAYLEPVYANFSENAFSVRLQDFSTPDFVNVNVPQFRIRQGALLDIGGSATLRLPAGESDATDITATIELRDTSVESLYTNLGKIAAAGTMFDDLETAGTVTGSVSIVDSALRSANLAFDEVILDDRGGRFAVYALDGAVDWSADEHRSPGAGRLRWESGSVYNISVGGGSVDLQLGDNDVKLMSPLRLPVLGGALQINQLELHNFGEDRATGTLDAELEPIQLGQLTGALGWPAFSGSLSGRLPLLTLEENTISVGGTLSARAFDGTMEISGLRIEQPFGLVPRLQADLAVRNLDLQRVTEAFSFGLIQGRLSGDVRALRMMNWRPVAMDMHFYTPVNDKSQHRISQRAVENLASVGGGGAAAVLSTGFLKFFDVFAYDRIALRCVLDNGVCRMSGAGPAKAGGGYYIVKGSGIPRIDVVGFRDAVSWQRLVQQLAAITRSGSPTVN